jgi:hypothetical protein
VIASSVGSGCGTLGWSVVSVAVIAAERRTKLDRGDGLDERLWSILSEILAASHRGDAPEFGVQMMRLKDEVVDGQRAGVYMAFLLNMKILERFGRIPTDRELHKLARKTAAGFERICRNDQGQLENTYRQVCERKVPPEYVGVHLVIFIAAALGPLLPDPVSELERLRPELAEWYATPSDSEG